MKNKVFVGLILFLIVIFSLLLTLTGYLLVEEVKDELSYLNYKNELQDYVYYFENGEYYKMYQMAIENEFKEGSLDADVSDFEEFAHFYHYLIETIEANVLNKENDSYELMMDYYNRLDYPHLKQKAEALMATLNE